MGCRYHHPFHSSCMSYLGVGNASGAWTAYLPGDHGRFERVRVVQSFVYDEMIYISAFVPCLPSLTIILYVLLLRLTASKYRRCHLQTFPSSNYYWVKPAKDVYKAYNAIQLYLKYSQLKTIFFHHIYYYY